MKKVPKWDKPVFGLVNHTHNQLVINPQSIDHIQDFGNNKYKEIQLLNQCLFAFFSFLRSFKSTSQLTLSIAGQFWLVFIDTKKFSNLLLIEKKVNLDKSVSHPIDEDKSNQKNMEQMPYHFRPQM